MTLFNTNYWKLFAFVQGKMESGGPQVVSIRVLKGQEVKGTEQDMIIRRNKKIPREGIKYFYEFQFVQHIT